MESEREREQERESEREKEGEKETRKKKYLTDKLSLCRISVIFRVRSAKAVKITDLDLMKRLGIIVGFFAVFLGIRTIVAPPQVRYFFVLFIRSSEETCEPKQAHDTKSNIRMQETEKVVNLT